MGCKAEGAAQGFTLLGGIVLLILAVQMIIGGFNGAVGGNAAALIDVLLAIALILMVLLQLMRILTIELVTMLIILMLILMLYIVLLGKFFRRLI